MQGGGGEGWLHLNVNDRMENRQVMFYRMQGGRNSHHMPNPMPRRVRGLFD